MSVRVQERARVQARVRVQTEEVRARMRCGERSRNRGALDEVEGTESTGGGLPVGK